MKRTNFDVDLFCSGEWGTVCDDGFDDTDAKVVCRQLGLPTSGAVSHGSAYYGSGYGRVLLDDVRCSGYEYRLEYCSSGWESEDCTHSEDVGVDCSKLSKDAVLFVCLFICLFVFAISLLV